MIFAPGQLAAIARTAGFIERDIPTAVATALASSKGDPAYSARAGVPGAGWWRGLWAINVDQYPNLGETTFATPEAQADAALWLCKQCGGWSWNDAYNNGTHEQHMAGAATAATDLYKPGSVGTPVRVYDLHGNLAMLRAERGDAWVDMTNVGNLHRGTR